MPTRLVREGINSSARINALSAGAEILYRRLMSVVDDYGRYYASPGTIRGACWPTAPEKVHEAQLMEWLAELSRGERPLIRLYYVAGCKYLEMDDFGQRYRSKSKFPDPAGNYEEIKDISFCAQFADNCQQSAAICEKVRALDVDEDEDEDVFEDEINPCATDVARVDEIPAPAKVTALAKADAVKEWYYAVFYPIYPRHKAREEGLKAARKHLTSGDLRDKALNALMAQLPEMNSREPSKRPYPASWINGKRWEDEPEPLFKPKDQREKSFVSDVADVFRERFQRGDLG